MGRLDDIFRNCWELFSVILEGGGALVWKIVVILLRFLKFVFGNDG